MNAAYCLVLTLITTVFHVSSGFVQASQTTFITRPNTSQLLMAKYNNMDEILAKFPDEIPVLINFYDASTEGEIKKDIVRAKQLLEGRCTLVSIKQQDYPGEITIFLS